MNYISKIQLPSGNTYYVKDEFARQVLAGGITYIIAWDGTVEPDISAIPAGITVVYNGVQYTGTLDANNAIVGGFYLVKSSQGNTGYYSNYVPVGQTGLKTWGKLGDIVLDLSNLGSLAYLDSVVIDKGVGKNVLGENTEFTNSPSEVTFNGTIHEPVLGADTQFNVTQPEVTMTQNTMYVKAEADNTEVGADGTASVIRQYNPTTDTFVKSVSAENNKHLVTREIVASDGVEEVSKVTPTTSKLVTTSVPNVTNPGRPSTFTFSLGSDVDAKTLIISGDNSVAPTLGLPIVAATGGVSNDGTGSNIVTGVDIENKEVSKAGERVVVATGETSEDGDGDAIVTDITIGDSAQAVTSLGQPNTADVLTGVKVTSQPRVKLSQVQQNGEGIVRVLSGITDVDVSEITVTSEGQPVDAVTHIGNGTATPQMITVNDNDRVKTFEYDDLSIIVS